MMTDEEILNLEEIKELIQNEYKEFFYENSFIQRGFYYFVINDISTKSRTTPYTGKIYFVYAVMYTEYDNNHAFIRDKMIYLSDAIVSNIVKTYKRNVFINKIIGI